MRNEGAPSTTVDEEDGHSSVSSGQDLRPDMAERPRVPRPPSYASDDGVSYVVEAQPRSIAPTTDVPLGPHAAEVGRNAGPAAW
jgi:hypothetical protein